MRFRAVSLSILVASGALFAADPDVTAKGTFKSRSITLDVRSAVAFHGAGLLDKDTKDALIVAVSNAKIAAGVVDAYYDRRRAIDKRLKDDETGIVYFEFTKEGRYRGFSYYFASGNGCGYCGGGDVAKVKLSGGKLSGTLKDTDKDKDRTFDITLDVPVLTDDHGPALPEGGGDPGKAYLAYHAALAKGDHARLKAVLSEESLKTYDRAEKKKDVDGYVRYLSKEHPTKSVRVTRGFAKADKAVLLVEGEASYAKLAGEVLLLKEKGTWRVDDELMDIKFE
jgi:hypothetical protein